MVSLCCTNQEILRFSIRGLPFGRPIWFLQWSASFSNPADLMVDFGRTCFRSCCTCACTWLVADSSRSISLKKNEYWVFCKNVMAKWILAIIFPHCLTMTAANQVSVDKCQESYRVITNCILSLFNNTTWIRMGKTLSSNTLSTQLPNVLSSFICLNLVLNSLQDFSTVRNSVLFTFWNSSERKHRQS